MLSVKKLIVTSIMVKYNCMVIIANFEGEAGWKKIRSRISRSLLGVKKLFVTSTRVKYKLEFVMANFGRRVLGP